MLQSSYRHQSHHSPLDQPATVPDTYTCHSDTAYLWIIDYEAGSKTLL